MSRIFTVVSLGLVWSSLAAAGPGDLNYEIFLTHLNCQSSSGLTIRTVDVNDAKTVAQLATSWGRASAQVIHYNPVPEWNASVQLLVERGHTTNKYFLLLKLDPANPNKQPAKGILADDLRNSRNNLAEVDCEIRTYDTDTQPGGNPQSNWRGRLD